MAVTVGTTNEHIPSLNNNRTTVTKATTCHAAPVRYISLRHSDTVTMSIRADHGRTTSPISSWNNCVLWKWDVFFYIGSIRRFVI